MPRYQVTHSSTYHFDKPVSGITLQACLIPRAQKDHPLEYHSIICQPPAFKETKHVDVFGNSIYELTFKKALQKVLVCAITTIKNHQVIDLDTPHEPLWNSLFELNELATIRMAAKDFGSDIFASTSMDKDKIFLLMEKIYQNFSYDPFATTVSTPISNLFKLKRGVCQDFSRVMIAVLSIYGFKTRYVSGYLFSHSDNSNTTRQSASHAWVSVYLKDEGWLGIDPTNNQWVNENYIVLAWGRDYVDVTPLKGHLSNEPKQKLNVSVTIEKLNE